MAERCLLGTMRKTSLDNARKTICRTLKIKIPIAIIASYGKPYPRANRWLGRAFQGRVVLLGVFAFSSIGVKFTGRVGVIVEMACL